MVHQLSPKLECQGRLQLLVRICSFRGRSLHCPGKHPLKDEESCEHRGQGTNPLPEPLHAVHFSSVLPRQPKPCLRSGHRRVHSVVINSFKSRLNMASAGGS